MSVLKDGHRRRRRYRQRVWALGWSRRPEPTEKGDGRVVGRDGNLRGAHQQRLSTAALRTASTFAGQIAGIACELLS